MSDILSIDFETAAVVDLRRTGAEAYSRDPHTRVLCMAWAFNDEAVQVWREGENFPPRVNNHVRRGGRVRGWNVSFEHVIWNNTLMRQCAARNDFIGALPREQIIDTMAAAAYWGLPLTLDMAAPAAGIEFRKDREGHDLMMRMSRPRAIDPLSGRVSWWHLDDPARFDRLCQYCAQDVVVERALANAVPPLPPAEQAIWQADQRINERGVGVDFGLVERLRDIAQQAAKGANQQIARITNGAIPAVTNNGAFLSWLRQHGYPYDNLRKETVAARLDEPGLDPLERTALEIRAEAAKTSAAKLTAMLQASPVRRGVGRVHGMLQYYGASRTGRWAGRLIQPQNMPRGTIKDVASAIDAIEAGASIEYLEAFFGPALAVISSALRGCFTPEPGNVLVVSDFSQIEARVIAWLAGQRDVLDVFRSGKDIYTHTAAKVGSSNRQLGKVLVLACGFGMSSRKFRDTAATYGVILTEAEADANVRAWRASNSKIVSLWWDYDAAAREVLSGPATCRPIAVGLVQFARWQGHLLIRLPSGRTLCYRDAHLIHSGEFGRGDQISYMGVDQYTRKWARLRTYGGKLAENVTQAVARDVMAEAVLAAERENIPVTLLVHDEIIGETAISDGQRALDALSQIMRRPPAWAPDLPVNAEGWIGPRYRK